MMNFFVLLLFQSGLLGCSEGKTDAWMCRDVAPLMSSVAIWAQGRVDSHNTATPGSRWVPMSALPDLTQSLPSLREDRWEVRIFADEQVVCLRNIGRTWAECRSFRGDSNFGVLCPVETD